jgi:hypothetical protein
MNFQPDTEHLDRREETDQRAIGGATAWLVFYAIGVVAVVASAFKGAEVVLALVD